jgi:hypothetical protein
MNNIFMKLYVTWPTITAGYTVYHIFEFISSWTEKNLDQSLINKGINPEQKKW